MFRDEHNLATAAMSGETGGTGIHRFSQGRHMDKDSNFPKEVEVRRHWKETVVIVYDDMEVSRQME